MCEPPIRWRSEDGGESREAVVGWLYRHFPTRESLIAYCCLHAKYVYASGATALTRLECPKAKITR